MFAVPNVLAQPIRPVPARDHAELVHVWEKSEFELLSRGDMAGFYGCAHAVRRQLLEVSSVHAYQNARGVPVAFIALAESQVLMLDVLPDYRNQGIGSDLLAFAVRQLQARCVELPEAWAAALAFYRSRGFQRIGPAFPGNFRGSTQTLLRLECAAERPRGLLSR